MSSYLFRAGLLIYYSGEGDVWNNKPTGQGCILYSIVTPIICCFGICGNCLSLMVLKRKELVGSVYTYLAVLAAVDLCMSIVLFLGGLSRGAFYYHGWVWYDALIGLPLGGAINTLSVLATVGVTIDRVIFLWNPVQCTKPKLCYPRVARRIMLICFIVSVIFNIPYCFIFRWSKSGGLTTTPFFDSKFYKAFNWVCLILFAVLPAIILMFGNGFLIISLQRARKISKKALLKSGKRADHTSLTLTLISIILLFLLSEIPASLVSRTSAINLLFQGDHDKANKAETLQLVRQICTLVSALNVTVNFLFYYLFCPAFCKALMNTLRRKQKCKKKQLQLNVFVLNKGAKELDENLNEKVKEKIMEISRKSIQLNFPACNKSEFAFPKKRCAGSNDTEESEYVEIIEGEFSSDTTTKSARSTY